MNKCIVCKTRDAVHLHFYCDTCWKREARITPVIVKPAYDIVVRAGSEFDNTVNKMNDLRELVEMYADVIEVMLSYGCTSKQTLEFDSRKVALHRRILEITNLSEFRFSTPINILHIDKKRWIMFALRDIKEHMLKDKQNIYKKERTS